MKKIIPFILPLAVALLSSCEHEDDKYCNLDLETNEFFLYNQCSVKKNLADGTYSAFYTPFEGIEHGIIKVSETEITWNDNVAPDSFSDSCAAKKLIYEFVNRWVAEDPAKFKSTLFK